MFPTPIIKWRNLKNGKIWNYEDLQEVSLYSYFLNPDKKDWLDFQLKPKAQLIDFLRLRGYQVEESASVNGISGSEHVIDILATRDDGLAKYRCGIGILIASRNRGEVGLEELFEFDTKAYDTGLDYKVVIIVPKLSKEAIKFAERQKIGVFEAMTPSDLIEFLNSQQQLAAISSDRAQSCLQDQTSTIVEPKGQIAAFLERRGYQVTMNQQIIGRSGADHIFDIIAYRDDVIVKPAIAVVVAVGEDGQVGIDKVAQFDAETFDAGVHNKIFVGIQRINEQARRFATQQKIRILEEADLADLIQSEK
jgi:hypothetical protein